MGGLGVCVDGAGGAVADSYYTDVRIYSTHLRKRKKYVPVLYLCLCVCVFASMAECAC